MPPVMLLRLLAAASSALRIASFTALTIMS